MLVSKDVPPVTRVDEDGNGNKKNDLEGEDYTVMNEMIPANGNDITFLYL